MRLRSRGTAAAVGETFRQLGGDPALDVAAALTEAEACGQVRRRGEEHRRSLSTAGEAELGALLAHETDRAGRADLATAYEAFLPVNRAFLGVLADPGDRRAAVVELVARLGPVLDALAERLPRFAAYPERFEHALAQAMEDPIWIESPRVDSVHTVWFELHEHLLATLGRERTEER
ncbi:MAG: hypothetical protein R2695_00995 [Acidimicrobiales bacterium]